MGQYFSFFIYYYTVSLYFDCGGMETDWCPKMDILLPKTLGGNAQITEMN